MKKGNAAENLTERDLPGRVKDHDHIHAANCGHPSVVHGNHIDYMHDGHYHYYLNGQTYHCEGPKASNRGPAQVIPLKKVRKK